MCIIVTKTKGAKPLDNKVFENCWDNNPNGAGILYNDGKTSTLVKGIMDKKEFLKKVKEANRKECSFVIHTRIATHGSVKPSNTHPFVSKTLGFAHNGTFNITPDGDTTDSETFFLHTIADKNFKWCKRNKYLLDMATKGCRCVVFDMDTGDMLYLNEDDWIEDKQYPGYKFSNTSYARESFSVNYYSGRASRWSWDIDDDDYDDYLSYNASYGVENDKKAEKRLRENWNREFNRATSVIKIPGISMEDGNVIISMDNRGANLLFPEYKYNSKRNEDIHGQFEIYDEMYKDALGYYPDDYIYIASLCFLRNVYGMGSWRTTYKTVQELDEAILKFFEIKEYNNLDEKQFAIEVLTNMGVSKAKIESAVSRGIKK